MKDNTIIDKIARSIERPELGEGGIKALPFVYETLESQNITLDTLQPPFCAAVPIESGAVQDERGMYHDEITMALFFGDLMCETMGDFDARKNERIIDGCKQRAFKWLASLQTNNEIVLVSVNGAAREYLRDDSVVTGYTLNVTLREVVAYGKCDL